MVNGGMMTVADGTQTVDRGTLMVIGGNRTVNSVTLTVAGGTHMVDGGTLAVAGGTWMVNGGTLAPSQACLDRVVTRPSNTLTFAGTRQRSDVTPHVMETLIKVISN
jgi:hypothetical protein